MKDVINKANMNCNSTPEPCMFFLEHRMGCAKKSMHNILKNLNGCRDHHIHDPSNYKEVRDYGKGDITPKGSIDHVEIKRLIQAGKTAKEIMEIVRISAPHLYSLARGMKLKMKSSKRFCIISIDDVRELAAQGLTAQEIAEKLDSKVETVRSRASRNGIKLKHGNIGRPSHNMDGRPRSKKEVFNVR